MSNLICFSKSPKTSNAIQLFCTPIFFIRLKDSAQLRKEMKSVKKQFFSFLLALSGLSFLDASCNEASKYYAYWYGTGIEIIN